MSTFPLSATARVRDRISHEGARRRSLVVLERIGLTDTLVRFTLGGDLAGFTSLGPEDHVKAFFPAEGGFVGRDYTPSEYRPIGGSSGPELDLDVVVHGDAGPATAWASRAGRGDVLEIGGARGPPPPPPPLANRPAC